MAFLQTYKALENMPQVGLPEIKEMAKSFFPFPKANPGQMEVIISAIDALVNKRKKHIIIEAPTGVGKSLIGLTIHQVVQKLVMKYSSGDMPQWRTAITTPTKGLQQQYAQEKHVNIAMLKGKKNYQCIVHSDIYYNAVPCRIQCRDGNCSPRRCPYVQARGFWTDAASLRCTNTAMMIEMCSTICMKPENRGDFIIIDECHKLPQALLDHTIMEYNIKSVATLAGLNQAGKDVVRLVAAIVKSCADMSLGTLQKIPSLVAQDISELHGIVEDMLVDLTEMIKGDTLTDTQMMALSDIIDILQNLSDYCGIMTDTQADTFIVQAKEDTMIQFKPTIASDVSEFGLFRKADYFLHMSATICGLDAYARSLGIPKHEYVTFQVENPIPIENRKINFMPIMKMTANMGDYEWKQVAHAVDDIIDFHEGQNGIIHTVSYDRALKIQEFSRHKGLIQVPRTRDALLMSLKKAIETKKPVVFASPAMEEGYDFKGDLGRFQILAKVPYAYLGDPLVAHVNKIDPSAYFREAILRIIQSCGRCVRGPDDWAATYILDQSFETLMARNPEYFPRWFLDAVFEV